MDDSGSSISISKFCWLLESWSLWRSPAPGTSLSELVGGPLHLAPYCRNFWRSPAPVTSLSELVEVPCTRYLTVGTCGGPLHLAPHCRNLEVPCTWCLTVGAFGGPLHLVPHCRSLWMSLAPHCPPHLALPCPAHSVPHIDFLHHKGI